MLTFGEQKRKNLGNRKGKRGGGARPVDFAGVLEEAECDGVDGRVAPALVEEAAGAIEVLEIVLVSPAAPKGHVGDLEVAPEVAGGVAVGLDVVVRAAGAVLEPFAGVVRALVFRVGGEELERFGPEGGDALRRVVQVDGEAVRFVPVGHVPEHVVVDVAEEVHLGLHPPVIPRVRQRRVVVEQARVPAAHLVVRHQVAVLDVLLLEHLRRFLK